MNNLQIFNNGEFGEIRTLEESGKVLFCGSDVAKALGYARPNDAVSAHCRGTVKRRIGVETGAKADGTPALQNVEMNFIPEGDVYRLITHSKQSKAEKFERWVFDEVLPSIRKTGSYSAQNCVQFPPKATSVGEVASIIKTLQSVMKHQNSHPVKIAIMAEGLCHQFGINIPDDFVEQSPWEQMSLINDKV